VTCTICTKVTVSCTLMVASAAVHNNTTESTRLPNGSNIFIYAIMRELLSFSAVKTKKIISFSDSMSSLETLSGFKLELHLKKLPTHTLR